MLAPDGSGRRWLTVPLLRGHHSDRIDDKRVLSGRAGVRWRRRHWTMLRHVYGALPNFSREKQWAAYGWDVRQIDGHDSRDGNSCTRRWRSGAKVYLDRQYPDGRRESDKLAEAGITLMYDEDPHPRHIQDQYPASSFVEATPALDLVANHGSYAPALLGITEEHIRTEVYEIERYEQAY